MKKILKNTKKANKFAYVVDMTACNTVSDLVLNIALAKHNAGFALTDEQLFSIVYKMVDNAIFLLYLDNMIYNLNNMKVKEKKTPWYKKFWNKITHKN